MYQSNGFSFISFGGSYVLLHKGFTYMSKKNPIELPDTLKHTTSLCHSTSTFIRTCRCCWCYCCCCYCNGLSHHFPIPSKALPVYPHVYRLQQCLKARTDGKLIVIYRTRYGFYIHIKWAYTWASVRRRCQQRSCAVHNIKAIRAANTAKRYPRTYIYSALDCVRVRYWNGNLSSYVQWARSSFVESYDFQENEKPQYVSSLCRFW